MTASLSGNPILRYMFQAGMFSLSASLLSGALMKLTIKPFVASDISSFLFLSLVLSLGIALVSILVVEAFLRLPSLVNYLIAMVLGILIGLFWVFILFNVVFNPYFGTFSFPVGTAWLVGSISGLISLAGVGSKNETKHLVFAGIITVLLSVFIGVRYLPLYIQFSAQRTVNSVWIKWHTGSEGINFDSDLLEFLTAKERSNLSELTLTGSFELVGGHVVGRGPTSRMVIIMQRPIDEPVELPIPEDVPVIYVQQDGGWIKHPIDAPVLSKALRLEPDAEKPRLVMARVEFPWGVAGFGAIDFTGDNPEP